MSAKFDPSLPPLVPETVLKKKRTIDELALARSAHLQNMNKRKRVVRGEDIKIKRPERFVMEHRIRTGSYQKLQRKKRAAKRTKTGGVKSKDVKEETVGFVIRIHEGRHANSVVKSELNRLGLQRKYSARFIRLGPEECKKLKHLDSYIAYGYISNNTVEELVHRRSYIIAKGGAKKALTDNITVEDKFGEIGIICLNDLSNEIATVGDNFDTCNAWLSTFDLSAPVGKFEKDVLKIHEGIEQKAGFIGDKMDELLTKLL